MTTPTPRQPRPRERKQPTHPSGDARYNAIDLAMKRCRFQKDGLLEVLHATQQAFGYLSEDLLTYVSVKLGVPLSQVYGVATFYHNFSFEPLGKHNCIICTGTACHVKGASEIAQSVSARYGLPVGSTRDDGLLSLTTARCLGSCGLAPVTVLDGEVHGRATPDSVISNIAVALDGEVEMQDQRETG